MKVLSVLSLEQKLFNLINNSFLPFQSFEIKVFPSDKYVAVILEHPTTINLQKFYTLYKVLLSKGITVQYVPKNFQFTLTLDKYKDFDEISFYDLDKLRY